MKTRKKIVSIILSLAMVISLMPMALAAGSGYQDTDGHWAETAIDRWSGYGVLEGDSGNFNPDGALTRAQMAAILSRLLNLPDAPDAGFSDVKPDDWFAEYINKCAAAGIMLGDNGKANPNEPITRQQAIVMIARALGIQPIENPDLTKYADAAQVSAYAQGYVAALIEAGIVGGVTADLLAPQANINRASTVTIFDRAIGTYANEAGQTIKADGDGLILIVAKDVKLTDVPEGTRIVVADGATGLTVNGKAVSDDQTYIVPETTTETPSGGSSSGGGHSHRYTYTDNGDGTHTGTCYADDSTRGPEKHIYISGTCIVCGAEAEGKTASVKNSDNGVSYYVTLPDAINAATDGDTVYLLADVTEYVTISKDLTLDLNEKTLTGEPSSNKTETLALTANAGKVTVKNGTINGRVNAYDAAELTIAADVTICNTPLNTNDACYGIVVWGDGTYGNEKCKTPTLHLYGKVIITANGDKGLGISTNGSDKSKPNIFIYEGASIEAPSIALYQPCGNVTVEGGTLTGKTALYFKAGELNIKGGTFIGNGDYKKYEVIGGGVDATGDAIVIDNCGYPAGIGAVSITGGTFTSTYAKAVASYATEGNSAVTKFITGGTFSSDPSAYVAPGYTATKNDADGVWTVSCLFAGGSGTEEDPFLIENAEQFHNISSAYNGYHYKLMNDITVSHAYKADWAYFATPYLYNGTFDGNNHTITVSDSAYAVNLFYDIRNSTIKDLNVVLDYSLAVECSGGVTFDNVDVSGEFTVTGNEGAYTIFLVADGKETTFKDCDISTVMTGNGDYGNYNALFIGAIYGKNDITLNFTNCVNTGKLICGEAAMFVGNPYGPGQTGKAVMTFNITNCQNNGIIREVSTNGIFSILEARYYTVQNGAKTVVNLDGDTYNNDDCKNIMNETLAGSGTFVNGPEDETLALSVNADGTFTITPATAENVDYYVISVGVYASLIAGGSNRTYVSERIEPSESMISQLKYLKFVDTTWVQSHEGAVEGDLAGNKIYTYENNSYYLMDVEGCTLDGREKDPQLVSVSAYDSEGKVIASVGLKL